MIDNSVIFVIISAYPKNKQNDLKTCAHTRVFVTEVLRCESMRERERKTKAAANKNSSVHRKASLKQTPIVKTETEKPSLENIWLLFQSLNDVSIKVAPKRLNILYGLVRFLTQNTGSFEH